MKEIILSQNEAGQRLDKLLHKLLPKAPNAFIYKMLRKKNITRNGKKADGSEKTKEGDCIRLFLSEETFLKFSGSSVEPPGAQSGIHNADQSGGQRTFEKGRRNIHETSYQKAYRELEGIRVLYEDAHVLLAHKPAGVLSQKASVKDISLNEWLIGYLLAEGKLTENELVSFRPSVCNRLDRNTSGLVICGVSLAGSQKMSSLLKDRTLHKYYRFLVFGRPGEDMELSGYLHKDMSANKVRVVTQAEYERLSAEKRQSYSPVITKCRVLEAAYLPACKSDVSLLEAELVTGKTHQIRAQLAAAGYPLLGDAKYGDRHYQETLLKDFGIKHQLLHAYRLEFPEMEAPFAALSRVSITDEMPDIYTCILRQMPANTPS